MGRKNTLEEAFGAGLRKLRQQAELTQEQLALNSGLDRTYISLLERGLRQPTLRTIFALAESLGVPPAKMIEEAQRSYS